MGDHSYQVGDRVWWLFEDSKLYRFTADVPAVVAHVRRDSLTIQATAPDGRSIAVHVNPAHVRPHVDSLDMVEEEAEQREEDPSVVAIPREVLSDLLATLATTHKWIETSLAGERAHSFSPAAIVDVMKLEFRQVREMNEDAMARARALLPEGG